MRKDFYTELVKCLNEIPSFNSKLLDTNPVSTLNVTVKDYNLKKGLSSKFLMNSNKYTITGPLGKGLGLTTDSSGLFIGFAAGTGVLVFIDLVAKMILQDLNNLPDTDEKLNDGFKFILFASFKNREDAIALPLLEGLQKLTKKFELILRFSD